MDIVGLEDFSDYDADAPDPYEEEMSIYEEFLDFADLQEFVNAVVAAGKLPELKNIVGKALFDQARVDRIQAYDILDRQKNGATGYESVNQKYMKQFEAIQHRGRIKLANFEQTDWEVVWISENSPAAAQQKRNFICKNKDRFLPNGVWCISSRIVLDDKKKKFHHAETIAQYLADCDPKDPKVLLIPRAGGRPRKARDLQSL